MVVNVRAATLTLLLIPPLAGAPALAADEDDGGRVTALLERNNVEGAWKICEKMAERSDPRLKEQGWRESCAEADYRRRTGDRSIEVLDAIILVWSGTPTAEKAREEAAAALIRGRTAPAELAEVVSRYPGTAAADRALEAIWAGVLGENTAAAMGGFADAWPDAPQAPEARERELTLAYTEAAAAGTPEAWGALLERYPEHPRRDDAAARQADAAWKLAADGTPSERLRFARDFPDHPSAPAALEEAVWALVEVGAVDPGADKVHTLRWGDARPPEVPAGVRSLQVVLPWEDASEPALVVLRGDRAEDFAAGFAAALTDGGLSSSLAKAAVAGGWAGGGGVYERELPLGLCAPRDAGRDLALRIDLDGANVDLPLRVDTPCAEAPVTVPGGAGVFPQELSYLEPRCGTAKLGDAGVFSRCEGFEAVWPLDGGGVYFRAATSEQGRDYQPRQELQVIAASGGGGAEPVPALTAAQRDAVGAESTHSINALLIPPGARWTTASDASPPEGLEGFARWLFPDAERALCKSVDLDGDGEAERLVAFADGTDAALFVASGDGRWYVGEAADVEVRDIIAFELGGHTYAAFAGAEKQGYALEPWERVVRWGEGMVFE